MSYSLSLPSVARDVEFEDLHDRVKATMDAVGYTEDNAAPGVRERILASVDHAMQLVDVLGLQGEQVQLNLSGHVNQGEDDPTSDTANIGVGIVSARVVE